MGGWQDKPAWTACPPPTHTYPGVKITRVDGKVYQDTAGRQAVQGVGQDKLLYLYIESAKWYRNIPVYHYNDRTYKVSIMEQNNNIPEIQMSQTRRK